MRARKHNDWRWLSAGLLLLLAQGGVSARETFEVMEVEGRVEQATGPAELQQLDAEDRITVRALIGFGRLPEPLRKLVLELRGQGVDALGAGANEIRDLIAQAEAGTLKADPQQLRALLALLEHRDYLDWTPLTPGATVELDAHDWIRGDGRAVLQAASGQRQTLAAEERPSQAGPIGASPDREPIAPATPIDETAATVPTERIWTSDGPGMRVFDHRRPDRGLSLETLEAASLAALPDGGYVAAGSVQGPGGREIWAARFDANDDLLWSRALGGTFDLHVTAATALGDEGVLIGGSLNEKQAGFLIALDAQGEPRWTQVLGGSTDTPAEVPLALATDAAGNALMAGETLAADRPPQGFAALIAADGQPGWRLDLPATAGVRSVILTDTGWSIAGEAADTSGAPWVASLDPKGTLIWERTDTDLAARGAPVLAGLDDGGIALAVRSAEGHGDQLWLRRRSPDGEPLETRRLRLAFGEQDGLDTLMRLTRDAEGALWLAGMTQGQDAWLARLSSTGEVLWSGRYGRAALDRFTDLHVRPDGLIAVGHTQSEDIDARGLWVVTLDATGHPRPAPEYSPAARDLIARFESSLASLDDDVRLGGAPLISQQTDGGLRFALPFLRIDDGLSDSNESTSLDLNWLRVDLTPGAVPNTWQATIDWPETLTLRNGDGNEIGTVRTAGHRLELDWPAPDTLPTRLDFTLEDLQVRVDGQARLQPIHEALGLPQGPDSLGSDDTDLGLMTLGALHLAITPESAPEAARTTASQSMELADLRIRSRSGTDTVQLGGLRVSVDYRDLDLAALTAGYGSLLEMIESDTETPDIETLRQTLERLLQASGQVETSVVMTDFAANLPSEDIDYRIAEFSVSAQGGPADDTGRTWNLRTGYGLRGLMMKEDGQDNRIDAFSIDLAIDRLALAAILDVALAQALEQPPAEASLAQVLGQPVAGAKLGFAIDALHIATPDEPPVNVDAMHFALALSEAAGPRPQLTLRYDHAGIGPIPDLPPELVPGKVDLGLVLSGLAPSTLAPVLLQGEPDPAQILGLLAQQAARLDIETIDVDMPGTGVRITGVANAEETAAPDDPGLIRLDLDIQVRDFDTLIARIGETLSPDEQRDLNATAALIKLMGNEEPQADGSTLHRFEVTGDSTGELKVNGKDLTPILDAVQ
ncbi:PQQ-like beta-propeller repeat protein [Allochromatium vinosum]|uniref:PQQ-like beta-propeller repeat protein n=1 Tax=Allochromatium vinosum TaxID=1049 RepID=UPI001908B9A2|nr:PQQ-like beta-propeller repeat protein [Allochromatium vinosum]MBK1655429.1 hypothetical protein [Allochromatium vinosum]